MDEHLAQLNRHVAAAADAWLTDPRDAGVYGRLVAAIEVRRRYLNPELDEPVDVDESGPPVGDVDEEEVLDDLVGDHGVPAPVGQDLAGDPVAALDRLRGGRPQPAGG